MVTPQIHLLEDAEDGWNVPSPGGSKHWGFPSARFAAIGADLDSRADWNVTFIAPDNRTHYSSGRVARLLLKPETLSKEQKRHLESFLQFWSDSAPTTQTGAAISRDVAVAESRTVRP